MHMKRKTYTYGVLPPKEDFIAAVGEHGFEFGNDPYEGNETLMCEKLWERVVERTDGDDEQREWVSCVLSVLGFEWV